MRKLQTTKASSTREAIILMLKTKASLTVSDIAAHLGITEMAVRRHLNTLEKDQFIQSQLVRQPMGRPVHVYSLTQKAHDLFPKHYAELSIEFLRDLEQLDGPEKVEKLFQLRSQRMVQEYKEKMDGLDLEERIKLLTDLQNEKGYMAEWKKIADGHYIFRENNCPISDVAREFSTVCSCELAFLQEILAPAVVECDHAGAKDGQHCTYTIRAT